MLNFEVMHHLVMWHQMNQYYFLEEEWDEKTLPKCNSCNDEFWSNAQLSDEAPDAPIRLARRRRMRWKIHPKFNCCNDELWSNAELSDDAPDVPILLSRRRRMRWKNTYQI